MPRLQLPLRGTDWSFHGHGAGGVARAPSEAARSPSAHADHWSRGSLPRQARDGLSSRCDRDGDSYLASLRDESLHAT